VADPLRDLHDAPLYATFSHYATPSGGNDERGPLTFLVQLTPQALVDSVLIDSLRTPLAAGTGPADPAEVADRLVGDAARCKGLSRSSTRRFRPSPLLLGENCSVVAIGVRTGGETLTTHHVSARLSGRYVVTGLRFDFDESTALLLRPI
jgi:hypothetical protein